MSVYGEQTVVGSAGNVSCMDKEGSEKSCRILPCGTLLTKNAVLILSLLFTR